MSGLDDVLEKEWQQQVIQLLRTLGYRIYHTYDSRRSQPGFPDLVCIRDRIIYLELKREKGKVSDAQASWMHSLIAGGAEAYVCRPRHLQHLATVLGPKGTANYQEARAHLLIELDRHLGDVAA